MILKQIAQHLAETFKDDPEKITAWWFTENPLWGGTPARLYLMRPEKFEKWFRGMSEK